MEVGDLYQAVLVIGLIILVVGIVALINDKFVATSGITATAAAAINNGTLAITPINSDWMPLIVLMIVLAIIITLLVRSFVVRTR